MELIIHLQGEDAGKAVLFGEHRRDGLERERHTALGLALQLALENALVRDVHDVVQGHKLMPQTLFENLSAHRDVSVVVILHGGQLPERALQRVTFDRVLFAAQERIVTVLQSDLLGLDGKLLGCRLHSVGARELFATPEGLLGHGSCARAMNELQTLLVTQEEVVDHRDDEQDGTRLRHQ